MALVPAKARSVKLGSTFKETDRLLRRNLGHAKVPIQVWTKLLCTVSAGIWFICGIPLPARRARLGCGYPKPNIMNPLHQTLCALHLMKYVSFTPTSRERLALSLSSIHRSVIWVCHVINKFERRTTLIRAPCDQAIPANSVVCRSEPVGTMSPAQNQNRI
jgi:hypothetical protein